MDQKSRLLTIGQFAALHGINKKTLMWYDEIGLFPPAHINQENGYRYYNYHQSSLLETILLLRELDVSINEIQEFMKHRSARNLKCLLEEKITELDEKLRRLEAVRTALDKHRQNMETLLTMDLSEIHLLEKEERYLVTVETTQKISYDKTVEMIVDKTKELGLRHLHDASYGTMIPVKSLYLGNFEDYSGLFIEIPFLIYSFAYQKTGLHLKPRGTYLQTFYQGNWGKMSENIKEILTYAEKHNLKLTGFSCETILNETVADREEDYIVQIEIPVRRL